MNWSIFFLFILFSLSVCCQVAVAWWRNRLSVPFALCAPPWINNTVVNVRTTLSLIFSVLRSRFSRFLCGIYQIAPWGLEGGRMVILHSC